MQEIEAHLDDTHFAWNQWDASRGSEDLFFFRIQSPVLIIEFDHQGTIDIPGEPDDIPIRQHITRSFAQRTAMTTAWSCCASIMRRTCTDRMNGV